MSLRAGTGYSRAVTAEAAGREAGRAATDMLGAVADAVLVFAGVGYDQPTLLREVAAATGAPTVVGCSAGGTIGRHGSDESACSVIVMALNLGGGIAVSAAAREVGGRERDAARELATALAPSKPALVVLLADGLTINGAGLVAELERSLAEQGITAPIVGGAAGEIHRLDRTYQYLDGEVMSNSAVALALGGPFECEIEVTHGCELLGIEHEVTRADGGLVFELDGQPTWTVLRQYLDGDVRDLSASSVPYLCVAKALADGPGPEPEFIVRVPLRLDLPSGAMFFSGGLATGDNVMMARRDEESIRRNAIAAARRMIARRPSLAPAAMLQFDCVGRGRLMFGDEVDSALIAPVLNLFSRQTPWIGFHSYGEIAPIRGLSQFHNFTVALCALFGTR